MTQQCSLEQRTAGPTLHRREERALRIATVLTALFLMPILLCGCNGSKEEPPYEAALVESQAYVATVSRLIRDMPTL